MSLPSQPSHRRNQLENGYLTKMVCSDIFVNISYVMALSASGLDHVTVVHRPRLLSDNGHGVRRQMI
jgi:hypothetical protein